MSIARGPLPVLTFGRYQEPDEDDVPTFGKTTADMELDDSDDGSDDDPRPPITMEHLAQTVLKAKKIVVISGKLLFGQLIWVDQVWLSFG